MVSVLRRHYPRLEPALRGVDNAFLPWSPVTGDDPGEAAAATRIPEGWRLRRGVWNLLVRFKFQQAKPFVVPQPSEPPPLTAVPFSQGFPDVPITGPLRRRPRAPRRVPSAGHALHAVPVVAPPRVPTAGRQPPTHRRRSPEGTRAPRIRRADGRTGHRRVHPSTTTSTWEVSPSPVRTRVTSTPTPAGPSSGT